MYHYRFMSCQPQDVENDPNFGSFLITPSWLIWKSSQVFFRSMLAWACLKFFVWLYRFLIRDTVDFEILNDFAIISMETLLFNNETIASRCSCDVLLNFVGFVSIWSTNKKIFGKYVLQYILLGSPQIFFEISRSGMHSRLFTSHHFLTFSYINTGNSLWTLNLFVTTSMHQFYWKKTVLH